MNSSEGKSEYLRQVAKGLVSVAQLGISLVVPPVVMTLIGVWLRKRFELGGFIAPLFLVFGLLTAFSTAKSFYSSEMKKQEKEKKEKGRFSGFSDHI